MITNIVRAVVLGAVASVACLPVQGAEPVAFESVAFTYPLSPFKIKQAKKKGIVLEPQTEPSIALTGFLARPRGDGPFPAVVLMHGCAGISPWNEVWRARLVTWGYVVLDVDSFTPRGMTYLCDSREISTATPWTRALDAYGAKDYLSTRTFVDRTRIAVMGMSHGGAAVLHAIEQYTYSGSGAEPFQAAISLYPLCREMQQVGTPTLILIGDQDTWTPSSWCVRYVDDLQEPHPVTLKVFPGAHHIFDHEGIDEEELGNINRYHPQAAAQAIQMIRELLEKQL